MIAKQQGPQSHQGGTRPLRNAFLVFGAPLIGDEEIEEVVATLRSGWLGTGPKTLAFEQQFRAYVGTQHALAVSSCTAGLHLILEAASIGPGDEVITTPITFAATANVIVHRGASPVFADVERLTHNLDPVAAQGALTERTRAIIVVHMAGRPVAMDAFEAIGSKRGFLLIEDAAHAIEARYRGRKVGALGDAAAFSFYPTKNVVTGEGGMVTTDRGEWAEEIALKRLHGLSRDAWKRYSAEGFQPYETLVPGYKYNMTDIQASLGIHQLRRVESNLQVRREFWERYDEGLRDLEELVLPAPVEDDIVHARHLYSVLVRVEDMSIDRNGFIEELRRRNIGTGIHFVALHLHRYYRERLGLRRGMFPHAEYISDRTVSLPLSAALTEADVDDVIAAVRDVLRAHRQRRWSGGGR